MTNQQEYTITHIHSLKTSLLWYLEDTITNGNIISDLTDHFSQFCILTSSNNLFDLQSKKMLLRDLYQISKRKKKRLLKSRLGNKGDQEID